MKRIIVLFSMVTLVAAACTKKAVPTTSTPPRTNDQAGNPPPPPPPQPQPQPAADVHAEGKSLFTAKCGRCHDLPVPANYTAERWGPIMVAMSQKARLDADQSKKITEFVKANAKK